MFSIILISSSAKLDRTHLIIPEHLLIRTQFGTNAPHLATLLSAPSFGHYFSPIPFILPCQPRHSDIICHHCHSFYETHWAPLISYQCPSFCDAPWAPPHLSPMPLILRRPLSAPSFLTNAPHFAMPLSVPFISYQCRDSIFWLHTPSLVVNTTPLVSERETMTLSCRYKSFADTSASPKGERG